MSNTKLVFIKTFLLAATCLVLMGCGGLNFADVQSVDPVVKIGLVAPFEGEQRAIGNDVIWATRLAIRQVNEAGGIDGHRVALVAYDDGAYPDEARNVAEALLVDPGVVAVIGHWTPETNAEARALYDGAGLAWVPMGGAGFGPVDAATLPDAFVQAYQTVIFNGFQPPPPGPFAGTAYDAMQLVFEAIDKAAERGDVTRESVHAVLPQTSVRGMTGTITVGDSQ